MTPQQEQLLSELQTQRDQLTLLIDSMKLIPGINRDHRLSVGIGQLGVGFETIKQAIEGLDQPRQVAA